MLIQLSTTQWLALAPHVRARLKEIFSIPRSSHTVVEDGKTVVSDGHTHGDLAYITVEAMQNFTGHPEMSDFFALFSIVLELIDGEKIEPAQEQAASPIKVQVTEELFINHNGKTYKLTEVPQQQTPEMATVPTPVAPISPATTGQAPASKAGKGTNKGRGTAGAKAAAKGAKGTK